MIPTRAVRARIFSSRSLTVASTSTVSVGAMLPPLSHVALFAPARTFPDIVWVITRVGIDLCVVERFDSAADLLNVRGGEFRVHRESQGLGREFFSDREISA